MAMKKTTKLTKAINKRTKLIDDSTRELLDTLSNVTDGAGLFFQETMPQHGIKVEWSDIEVTEKDYVLIKGVLITGNVQLSAANVMVISVPIEMAADSTSREIADYMIKTSGKKKTEQAPQVRAPTPVPPISSTEFDIDALTPKQREALALFAISKGGKP